MLIKVFGTIVKESSNRKFALKIYVIIFDEVIITLRFFFIFYIKTYFWFLNQCFIQFFKYCLVIAFKFCCFILLEEVENEGWSPLPTKQIKWE